MGSELGYPQGIDEGLFEVEILVAEIELHELLDDVQVWWALLYYYFFTMHLHTVGRISLGCTEIEEYSEHNETGIDVGSHDRHIISVQSKTERNDALHLSGTSIILIREENQPFGSILKEV